MYHQWGWDRPCTINGGWGGLCTINGDCICGDHHVIKVVADAKNDNFQILFFLIFAKNIQAVLSSTHNLYF